MAGYPPGVPPVPPVPPRDTIPAPSAAYLRDQARAQRAAFRAQRDQMRYQMRSMRRGSILGPILLIAIGIVFLLIADRPARPRPSGTGMDTGGRCCWSSPAWWCWRSGRLDQCLHARSATPALPAVHRRRSRGAAAGVSASPA